MILKWDVDFVFLHQIEQILYKVHAIEQVKDPREWYPQVVMPLYLLFHEHFVGLNDPLVCVSARLLVTGCIGDNIGHDELLNISLFNVDTVHPHTAFDTDGLLDMQQAPSSQVHKFLNRLGIPLFILVLIIKIVDSLLA